MILLSLLDSLQNSLAFTSWKKEHDNSFVSHFFIPINSTFEQKGEWEIGYYIIDTKKVTTFILEKEKWILKSSDQLVANTGKEDVTKLDTSTVKISFEDAMIKVKDLIEKEFPGHLGILGEGFCILQQYKGTVLWNVSFITQKMTMINIKISAVTGEFFSKDEINFLGK
jgi:hypothetical protein